MEITQYVKNGSLDSLENKEYPRAVVRDYLRSIGLPYAQVDAVCKLIPQGEIGESFPENITSLITNKI